MWASSAASSPAPCCPFLASPSYTALVLSARRGQRGQGTASIGRGLYVERLTAGSTAAARKCLLITRKIIIPPPDSGEHRTGYRISRKNDLPPDCWDPRATSSHARKCVRKKTIRPLTAGTHQLHLRTQGSASEKMIRPPTAGTHQLHLRTQGSASGQKKTNRPPDCWAPAATPSHARKCVRAKKKIRPPDCWDPPSTSLHARKCLTVGTHLVEAYVALSF